VNEVIVVSGMPRSGTSLMMQMLAAGGVPVLTDGRRAADEHNPRGYFEDERVLRLARDTSWFAAARGKAVKVIYRLLPHLPSACEYRVLFMQRDLEEVYASQQTMLRSRDDAAGEQDRMKIVPALRADLERVRNWVSDQPNIHSFDVLYADLIAAPAVEAQRIADFLERNLDAAAMASVVEPALYRHRR
jgi:hypothetical protein